MKASSRLDRVVQNLEQDVNVTRIKKLIFFACEGTWDNDPGKLYSLNLRDLVEKLAAQATSVELLKEILDSLVAKLNKKEEYYLVASTILSHVGQLYSEDEDTTQIIDLTPEERPEVPQGSLEQNPDGSSEWKQIVYQYDLFDVRLKLMQQTNPLRAKILIFSSLYHPFTFSDRDWSLLKKQQIDELLRNLCYDCESLEILSAKLKQAAQQLDQPDEYLQAIKVIPYSLQALYRYYPREETSVEQRTNLAKLSSRNGKVEISDRTQFTQLAEHSYFLHDDEDEDKKQILPPTALSVPTTLQPVSPKNLPDVSELTKLNFDEPAPDLNVSSFKVSDSIKQKLALEADIKDFVNHSVGAVTRALETTLSELENALEKRLNNEESIEEKLTLKYQGLRDFVEQIQKVSVKFTDLITQLESAERHRLAPEELTEDSSNASSQLNGDLSKVPGKVLELAKQANPKAIAALVTALLADQTLKVIVILKNNFVHIILESDSFVNQTTIVNQLTSPLAMLNSPQIQGIKLHGRITGSKSVSWTQEMII